MTEEYSKSRDSSNHKGRREISLSGRIQSKEKKRLRENLLPRGNWGSGKEPENELKRQWPRIGEPESSYLWNLALEEKNKD